MSNTGKKAVAKNVSTIAEQSVALEQNTFIRSLESLVVEESSDEEGRPPAVWHIGWHTISMMTGLILAAILFIVGFHFFCTFVHGKVVSDESVIIPQSAVNYITNQVSFIVRTLLLAAVVCSYEQRIWHEVRIRAYSIDTISIAFGMIHYPFVMFNKVIFRRLTVPLLIILTSWFLPLASVFAPGCLSVANVVQNKTINISVPTLDWSHDLGLFSTYPPFGQRDQTTINWHDTSKKLQQTIYMVAFGGETITWTSPCGSTCSYTLHFEGLSWSCKTETVTRPVMLQQHTYLGRTNILNINPSSVFEIWSSSLPNSSDMNYTSCRPFEGIYMVNVSFNLNIPSVRLISFTAQRSFHYDPNTLNSTINLQSKNDWKMLNGATLLSAIDRFFAGIKTPFERGDIMIAQTALLDSGVDLANGLEQFLQNVTTSLISWKTDSQVVPVTIESVVPTYIYTPWRLILPFAIATSAVIACVAIGIRALLSNGVPSELSFRQIVATTRNPTLDKCAVGACLGGRLLPLKFRHMRLRYGAMKEQGSGRRHAGFGLAREVGQLDPLKHYW